MNIDGNGASRLIDGSGRTVNVYGLIFTGEQYIDTGLPADGLGTRIVMEFALTSVSPIFTIFGARRSINEYNFGFAVGGDANNLQQRWRMNYGNTYTTLAAPGGNANLARNVVDAQGGVFRLNGAALGTPFPPAAFTTGGPGAPLSLVLGGLNDNVAVSAQRMRAVCYRYRHYDTTDPYRPLRLDLIPVPQGDTTWSRVPAPSPCMWDAVSRRYFENAGTGDFGIVGDGTAYDRGLLIDGGSTATMPAAGVRL